jgi:DNA polymerase, archaea type
MGAVSFFPMDIDYRVYDDSTEIHIYGRRIDGRQICVIDKTYSPHFYVLLKDKSMLDSFGKKLQELKVPMKRGEAKVQRVEIIIKRHQRKNVDALKIILQTPFQILPIAGEVSRWPEVSEILESDISFIRKYSVEKGIIPMTLMEAEGDYETRRFKIPVFQSTKIRNVVPETLLPRPLFFDIKIQEMIGKITAQQHPIVAVSFFGKDFQRTITWKRFQSIDQTIEFVESEAELISRFQAVVEDFSPDILVGFFSENFDLPYLFRRAQKYKLKLDLGPDYSQIIIGKRVQITGMAHLDLSELIKRIFSRRVEFGIENIDKIAKEIVLENTFSITSSDAIEDLCKKSMGEVKSYAYIYEQLFPFVLELSKLLNFSIKETLNLNPYQIAEWYVLRPAIQRNMLIPNKLQSQFIFDEKQDGLEFTPEEKVYKNIFSLDLRNMAASLSAKYNISFDSMRCADCKNITREDPWFCTTRKGMIPEMIDDLISRKSRISAILSGTDESRKTIALVARYEAIATLVHMFSKYVLSPRGRYYDEEVAKSLKLIEERTKQQIIKKIQEKGFEIVYFDRDFVFAGLGKKRKEESYVIAGILNELHYADVDVEGIFRAGLFIIHKKGKRFVKYALMLQDKSVKTKSFELVQRNTGNVTREAQEKAIKLVLENGNASAAFAYLHEVISKLRNRKFENKDIVISNEMQKEVDSYDSVWPFVAVARQMIAKGISVSKGSIVQYIVVHGKERVSDRAKMPEEVAEGDYDAEYYINTQLIPAVSDIFEAFGYTKESLVEVKEQTKLEGFFQKT